MNVKLRQLRLDTQLKQLLKTRGQAEDRRTRQSLTRHAVGVIMQLAEEQSKREAVRTLKRRLARRLSGRGVEVGEARYLRSQIEILEYSIRRASRQADSNTQTVAA